MAEAGGFLVIAHRGASSYAPENTFAAFDLALAQGARHIEFDLETSADGEIVVIHDATVDRTTDGTGSVSELSLAQLRALDAGSWFAPRFAGQRIPTFAEMLDRYRGRAHLHVEIKGHSPELSARTARAIRQYGAGGGVTITSFQIDRLAEMRQVAPELPCGWLVRELNDGVIARARELGLVQICPRGATIDRAMVVTLRAAGFGVRAWGVPDEETMRRVVDAGADGMTVNFPDRLIEYLGARR